MNDAQRDEIAKLESLYAMNPEGRVFTHLAEACRKAGELERARQILEDGLQRHPDYASAHVVLGRVLADCGEVGTAATEFRRVLELDRHNLIALRSLGELASLNGRIDEAVHYYSELAVLDPTDPALQEELRSLEARRGSEERPADTAEYPSDTAEDESAEGGEDAAAGSGEDSVELLFEGEVELIEGEDESSEDTDEVFVEGTLEPFDGTADGFEIVAESPIDVDAAITFEPEPEPELAIDDWLATGEAGDEGRADRVDADSTEEEPAGSFGIGLAGFESNDAEGATESISEELHAGVADGGDLILDDPTDGSTIGGDEIEIEITEISRHLEAEATDAEPASVFAEEAGSVSDTEPGSVFAEEAGSVSDAEPGSVFDTGPGLVFDTEPGSTSDAEPEPTLDEAFATADDADVSGSDEGDAVAGDESDQGPDEGSDEGSDQAIDGRWQAPASIPADQQAERSGPAQDTGEWIPAERWEWVAASADTSGSVPAEPSDSDESEAAGAGSRGSSDESGQPGGIDAEVGPAEFDAETSFAELNAEPVDSFEAGAAAVLDAFVRGGDEVVLGGSAEPAASTDEPEAWLEEESAAAAAGEVELEAVAEPGDWPAGGIWTTGTDDDSGDQVITETLAEIYASQGLYDRAAAVYRRLVEQNPGDERLSARLADLQSATDWTEPVSAVESSEETEAFLSRVESAWTGGESVMDTDDSPYAWQSEAGVPEDDPGARVGDYFAALLAWRPSQALPSVEPAPTGADDSETVGAWFSSGDRDPDADDAGGVGREGEEDLEMFRSWLKSLKK